MARKKQKLKLPPAPPGLPLLPSEERRANKADTAPVANVPQAGGAMPPLQGENPASDPLAGREPRWPFIPPRVFEQGSMDTAELEGLNRVWKIMLFYDEPETYRAVVRKFGEEHKFYKDKFRYGNQEENQDTKGPRSKSAVARNSGRSFYNS